MSKSDKLENIIGIAASEVAAASFSYDLLLKKNDISQSIRKCILASNPIFSNYGILFEELNLLDEVSSVNENLSNVNVPLSQPLGIITDNIFDESNKEESKVDMIMRRIEEYYLLPVESQSLPDALLLNEEKEDEIADTTDRLVIPDSLKLPDGIDYKTRRQFFLDQFPTSSIKDPEQQLNALIKFVVQRIHELINEAEAVRCEYGREIPTPYGKLLSYITGFLKSLPALPCIIQMASFTIFKDLPIYFAKALLPRRWLIIAPSNSRALKETVLELKPTYYYPGGKRHLESFKSGPVVYFYNQDFELEELLQYRWDCTLIFGEAKEKKPSDKAFDLFTTLEKHQKERLGFTIIMFETSENLWSKVASNDSLSHFKWFFPILYEVAATKNINIDKIMAQFFSSIIPLDENQQDWMLKILDHIIYKANNDTIYPFLYLYNEASLNLSYEKLTKLMSQIQKQLKFTTLDNMNVIFMNENETSIASSVFSKNEIETCMGEDIPGKLRLSIISEVYNIEARNVFVFSHFSIELAGKLIAVMRKPGKYDKTIWFLHPKSHEIDMETLSTFFEVCRQPFLDEEGRKTCMDDPKTLTKLKKEIVKEPSMAKKLADLGSVFNQELRTEAGGTDRYATKFRKFLHIYQNAKKQQEMEQRQQQKENDSYQPDAEMEPPTPTSKLPRPTKKKPAPLKTVPSRPSISKRPQPEQQNVTNQSRQDRIKALLPPSVGVNNRLPFAPLQRAIIKKVVNEKQRLGPLDPIDEFNLCNAALKFQLFGNYFRNIEKNSEYYRAASYFFNWDAVCIYFNHFLNCSNNYTNKLNLNKKFFTRFFKKAMILRTVCVDTDIVINRRQYEREFYNHLCFDDERPQLLFNFRAQFERSRHHSQPISTEGISESSFNTLGMDLSVFSNDYFYTDLIDAAHNVNNDDQVILPENSFSDMLNTDFDLLLLNYVTKNSNRTLPSDEYIKEEMDTGLDYDEMFCSSYISDQKSFQEQNKNIRTKGIQLVDNIHDSCQTILDYGDFIVDGGPISPTEASECDNIKEDLSYSKSLDAMETSSADVSDDFIGIGPTRRKIRSFEVIENYNLSSEIMPYRVSPSRRFDDKPLALLFGSICNENDDENSEYGSAASSDEENIDFNNDRKRKAVVETEAENGGNGNDVKRRKIEDESGTVLFDSNPTIIEPVEPAAVLPQLPPKFHLSPSEDMEILKSDSLEIEQIEEEINFAVFYLMKQKSINYVQTCRPYLNSLDNISKLSILQHSTIKNCNKLAELERNFSDQPSLRQALVDMPQNETIKDVFEEMINFNGIFSRESLDENEMDRQTAKKFTISFNDLMLRQYYERAIPITTSSQKYSYGDTSVMPSKSSANRRSLTSQTPPSNQGSTTHGGIQTPARLPRPQVAPTVVYRPPMPTNNVISNEQIPYQRVLSSNFNHPRPLIAQQSQNNGAASSSQQQPVDTVALRSPSTPQHQPIIRQPMQVLSGQAVLNQLHPPRPLNFPYEYHLNCECSNKELGQQLFYNDHIPNYDDAAIDPFIKLEKIAETSSTDSSLALLYKLCQSVPFSDAKLKNANDTMKLLANINTTEFTPPVIPALSLSRSNCLRKSRERFKNRQQIFLTLRGYGKNEIMSVLKQYELKFNIPFHDSLSLQYRRLPFFDARNLMHEWRLMSLSKKLRRIMNVEATNAKTKFLQSLAPRAPLERSAEMEDINNEAKRCCLKRSLSLPNLSNAKILTPSQIAHIKAGFKKAVALSPQYSSKPKYIPHQMEIDSEENAIPAMPKEIQKPPKRVFHLGISNMSLTIYKRKISTFSRFYRTRRHPNPRKILPLYRRWKNPYHIVEYWKYTKDKRKSPPALFDMNLE